MAAHQQPPPTPRAEWVKVGDRCTAGAGMAGTVTRIMPRQHGLPSVRVAWDSGSSGTHTITILRAIPPSR